MPFVVGAGLLPEIQMHDVCLALSEFWGGEVLSYSTNQDPIQALKELPTEKHGIAQLIGDAAMFNRDCGSWLEALGAWRKPTLLIAMPLDSGELPGLISAYVALSKELSVPLVGVVQLGGDWNPQKRKLDGLPWCGFIPQNERDKDKTLTNKYSDQDYINIQKVIMNLRRNIESL